MGVLTFQMFMWEVWGPKRIKTRNILHKSYPKKYINSKDFAIPKTGVETG